MTGRIFKALFALVPIISVFIRLPGEASTLVDSSNRFAWSENAGWINAAPTNSEGCIHFDGTSGHMTGYAWCENVGWIKFGDGTGGPYANDSASDWGVNLDSAGNLSGYAWGENIGWIRFDPSYGGVAVDMTNGFFSGYAWGENIGWVAFEGPTTGLLVRTEAFDLQPHGTPNWWLDIHGVGEEHDEGDGHPAWKEYVADTDPNDTGSCLRVLSISNTLPVVEVAFSPASDRRYYTLELRESLVSGNWTNSADHYRIQGNGSVYMMDDNCYATQQYYRIRADLTP